MDLNKYIYVSPQYFSKGQRQWNYEYINNGEFLKTQTFGYHEGKEVLRSLEIDAWLQNKRLRVLNQFQWRDLKYIFLGGKFSDVAGNKIMFHSKAQFEKFSSESELPDYMVKTLRQLTSGEIVLQHISGNEGSYLGFLSIIGKRGGVRRECDYCVNLADGEPYLVRRLGSLFD